jgi:hypothetical protein
MKKRCTLSQLTSLVGACPIARGRVPGMAFTPRLRASGVRPFQRAFSWHSLRALKPYVSVR